VRAGRLAVSSLVAAALAAVAAATVPDARGQAGAAPQDSIAATADFSPRIVLFGDTLTARVDVVVDPSAVDPESVKVSWDSKPWAATEVPRTTVERAGSAAHVGTTFVLRCLTAVCAPVRETERVDLEPAKVAYTSRVGGRHQESLDVAWPTLVLHTRVGELDSTARDALAAPWRADFDSLPAVSYLVPPWLAIAVLVVLGLALLALAAIRVYRVWPRRESEPEPEPEPEPVASVLEQALALLEAVSDDGAEERRRALELVADEVEHLGDDGLALDARVLAWSPIDPDVERTRALAADLRVRFADVLEELEVARSNGGPAAERTNGGHP
jgi:hypothetical protein